MIYAPQNGLLKQLMHIDCFLHAHIPDLGKFQASYSFVEMLYLRTKQNICLILKVSLGIPVDILMREIVKTKGKQIMSCTAYRSVAAALWPFFLL